MKTSQEVEKWLKGIEKIQKKIDKIKARLK
jgi:hypothetical protein